MAIVGMIDDKVEIEKVKGFVGYKFNATNMLNLLYAIELALIQAKLLRNGMLNGEESGLWRKVVGAVKE